MEVIEEIKHALCYEANYNGKIGIAAIMTKRDGCLITTRVLYIFTICIYSYIYNSHFVTAEVIFGSLFLGS